MVRHVILDGYKCEVQSDWTSPIFHSDPTHPTFRYLREAGVDVQKLPNSIESGTVLIPRRTGPLYELVYIVDRLLGPGGCPWDIEQTHASLKKHLIEEAYEVGEAIDQGDLDALKEELGDLLLQPLMHTQMEKRDGSWSIDDVAQVITEKLVRRHPHVFGVGKAADADEVLRNWDRIKKAEKQDESASVLGKIPKEMPALLQAFQISKRAARSGFEWPDIEGVWDKLHEEEAELRQALKSGSHAEIESEIGDLLFTVVNIARWCDVEPEDALRAMLARFTTRFQHMETLASKPLAELSPEEWDRLWQQSKQETHENP